MFGHGNFGVSSEATVIFLGGSALFQSIPVTLTLGYPLRTTTAISTPQCNQ